MLGFFKQVHGELRSTVLPSRLWVKDCSNNWELSALLWISFIKSFFDPLFRVNKHCWRHRTSNIIPFADISLVPPTFSSPLRLRSTPPLHFPNSRSFTVGDIASFQSALSLLDNADLPELKLIVYIQPEKKYGVASTLWSIIFVLYRTFHSLRRDCFLWTQKHSSLSLQYPFCSAAATQTLFHLSFVSQ